VHNIALALEGAWKVLLAGLLLGAGLPAIFALGIRSLGMPAPGARGATVTGTDGTTTTDAPTSTLGKALAALCFGLVLLGVALGITFIVASGFGKQLVFENVYPTLIDK
jgi:hypothetical protein